MKKDNEIYLGKSGEIYGPYSAEEFDGLMAKNQLSSFHWIWDWQKETWMPLEAPPPSLIKDKSSEGGVGRSSSANWSDVEALCFDRFRVISGKIQAVTQTGCQLVLAAHEHDGMQLSEKGPARLDLFMPSSRSARQRNTVQVPVQVVGIQFLQGAGKWVYRLRWNEMPKVG